MADTDPPRELYLIVANRANCAMLYCASPGYDGRVRAGYSQYFAADSEVFVLGAAAAKLPRARSACSTSSPGSCSTPSAAVSPSRSARRTPTG